MKMSARSLCATNVPWGTRRSTLIGLSASCYLLPSLVDDGLRRWFWVVQALVCFWSDYVDSGRWGVSHLVDKVLASSLTVYVIWLACITQGFVFVAVLALPTFTCLGLSTRARKRGQFQRYSIYHALWHLTSSISCVITLTRL